MNWFKHIFGVGPNVQMCHQKSILYPQYMLNIRSGLWEKSELHIYITCMYTLCTVLSGMYCLPHLVHNIYYVVYVIILQHIVLFYF